MKTWVIFLLLLSLSAALHAQKPMATPPQKEAPNPLDELSTLEAPKACKLSIDQSPSFRGLRLGMKDIEFEKLLPSATFLDNTAFVPKFPRSPGFEGVLDVRAEFFEKHLYDLSISYTSDTASWKHAREFASYLSTSLKLPTDLWKMHEYSTQSAKLDCTGFVMTIFSDLRRIDIYDPQILGKVSDRNSAADEAKKKAFKP